MKEINRKGSRKEWFFDAEKMSCLFDFYEKGEAKDQEGKELFEAEYRER